MLAAINKVSKEVPWISVTISNTPKNMVISRKTNYNYLRIIFGGILLFCGFAFAMVHPGPSQAAVGLSLTPASGNFTGPFSVGLYANANPGTDQIAGLSVNINYSGPITYSSYSDGASNCQVTNVEASSGSVHLECLATFPEGYITEPSTVASLSFVPSASGTATIEIEVVEIGYITGTLGSVTGGSYAVHLGTLPDTGVFSNLAIAGGLIILAGAVAIALTRKQNLLELFGNQSRVIIQKSDKK